ncbi:MAG: AI-2E family transporter [Candidatus Rokuibacteriota bacterium]
MPARPARRPDARTLALVLLAVLAVAGALKLAREVFIPIVLALLLSYTLDPIVRWLGRFRVPRALGAAMALGLLTMVLGGIAHAVKDEALALVDDLPVAARRLSALIEGGGPIQKVQEAADEIQAATGQAAGGRGSAPAAPSAPPADSGPSVRRYVWWSSLGALGVAGQLVMIGFLVYFVLASGDLYRRKLLAIAGRSPARHRVIDLLDEVRGQIGRFLLVWLATAVIVGVATWLALLAVGLEGAAFWGTAAGLVNAIPYFGPIAVTAGLLMVALLQFGTLEMAALVAGIALAITSLEGWLLTPWLFGRAARMNHVAVFIALIVWGWIWGVWGVLLAVPMMVVIKAVCERVERLQPVSELLGE